MRYVGSVSPCGSDHVSQATPRWCPSRGRRPLVKHDHAGAGDVRVKHDVPVHLGDAEIAEAYGTALNPARDGIVRWR